ncbi:MAG: SARP family transcriptional regulator, partial [Actinomycetota bacterium]|nr:SARP family transcriptional regulator [Actinomycetota bacterium]
MTTSQVQLTVALLGTPLIERAGRPVAFDTRKAVALLAYLAVTGQVQSRESLTALLWPEHDRTRGLNALRRTLSVLNSATGGECLVVDRHTIGLHPERVSVDVTSFREKAADVHHGHPAERSCRRCLAAFEGAAAIYRDDFLAGFALRDSPEYDAWQSFQADSLRRRLGEVLERLVRARTQAGHPRAALDEARRWLALDPLHEPAHAALMRLYAWSGQRSAALQQYRECVRVLDRELGVAPLSRTTALNDAIRAGRLPPPEAPAVTPPAKDRPVPPAVYDLPLVG